MNKSVIISVVVLIIATLGLAVGAFSLLGGGSGESETVAESSGVEVSVVPEPADMSERPDCPANGAGGVELPCLGGENGESETDPEHITVVNLWAWWCGPCRDELPIIEEYAEENPDYTVVGVHADTNAGYGADLLTELEVDIASYQDSDNQFAGTLGLPNVIPITVVFRGDEQIGLFAKTFESAEELDEAVQSVV